MMNLQESLKKYYNKVGDPCSLIFEELDPIEKFKLASSPEFNKWLIDEYYGTHKNPSQSAAEAIRELANTFSDFSKEITELMGLKKCNPIVAEMPSMPVAVPGRVNSVSMWFPKEKCTNNGQIEALKSLQNKYAELMQKYNDSAREKRKLNAKLSRANAKVKSQKKVIRKLKNKCK